MTTTIQMVIRRRGSDRIVRVIDMDIGDDKGTVRSYKWHVVRGGEFDPSKRTGGEVYDTYPAALAAF